MEVIIGSSLFMLTMLATLVYAGKNWGSNNINFLFANRTLTSIPSGLAINAHWFWAIALFVGPAVAYNWGWIGLLWFAIPNALSLLIMAFIGNRIRNNYPDGFSLSEYIQENFSPRIGKLFQLQFVLISFAGLLLSFTAISKLWGFAGLTELVSPLYASLVVGLITLGFTVRGGIRSSIFSGATMSILWLVFFSIMAFGVLTSDVSIAVTGKNALDTVWNEKFLTNFALAFLVAIGVGATSHGMMWQKTFSMPKENIWPSFIMASVIFFLVLLGLGSLSLYTFSSGMAVPHPELSALVGITSLFGTAGLVAFSILLIGQTSTIMDAAVTYMASLSSREWLKKDDLKISKIAMVLFIAVAWLVSWLKLEIWTIFMLMGAVRIVMFATISTHALGLKVSESATFYSSIVAIIAAIYLAYTARVDKLPIYDMYSAYFAIGLPLLAIVGSHFFNKFKRH